MDIELNEEQIAFVQVAKDFAAGVFAPQAALWDENEIFPREALSQAGTLGFCGLYASTEIGGLGLSRLDASLVFEEMAAIDPSTTAFLTIHNMATWMVGQWGSQQLRQTWGPTLSTGEKLASYCLTEPGAGSDAASLRTSAKFEHGQYILNGAKAFISGAGETDLLIVMARTGAAGASGISAFAVPGNSPGITYGRKERKMGWNSQSTRSVTFENVRIPFENLLGQEGEGFKIAMRGLDGGRINIATCSVGAAQGAIDTARHYMQNRKQFNQPLTSFQALQFKFADMVTNTVAARQMVRLAACKLDAGTNDASSYCAMAKRFATPALMSAWMHNNYWVAMVTLRTTQSRDWCATPVCTRS